MQMAYIRYVNDFIRLAEQGRALKAIVVDLDGTLWEGVIGEGEIVFPEWRLDFQRELLHQRELGVMLCVASRNNLEDALAGLNDPRCLLKPQHVTVMEVGWDDKATMLKRIAAELEVEPKRLLFWDDDINNRALVMYDQELRGLRVQGGEDAVYWPRNLREHPGLQCLTLTAEDLGRVDSYERNKARRQVQGTDLQSYLEQLGIVLDCHPVREHEQGRVRQLAQRTTQFNLNGESYREDLDTYVVTYRDNYGDEGLVGAAQYTQWRILRIWLSCRILGRGVEWAFLAYLLSQVERTAGIAYQETPRNAPMYQFLEEYWNTGLKETPWITLSTPSSKA
jgi:FkbH-like protein